MSVADDELSLLVIVIDTNPIWWGKRAQGEAEVRLLLVLGSEGRALISSVLPSGQWTGLALGF